MDMIALYDADKLAHDDAIRNGGVCPVFLSPIYTHILFQLILYWYGIPNPETGMNLATCVWQSRKHAMAATSRPHHVNAMRLAADVYDVYVLERHVLRKIKGEEGVKLEAYTEGEVGW